MKKDTDLCWAISPTQYKMKVFLCLDPCLITNVYFFSYCCWSVFVFFSISMDTALTSHSRKLLFCFFRISMHFFILATSWTNHHYATSFLGFKMWLLVVRKKKKSKLDFRVKSKKTNWGLSILYLLNKEQPPSSITINSY